VQQAADITTQVYFTDIMPKTATGKVQRRLVAKAMINKEMEAAKGMKQDVISKEKEIRSGRNFSLDFGV